MPAMQGEVYVELPARVPQPFVLGEAMDAGLDALKRDGVVLTAAHLVAALPGLLLALASRYAFGEPRLASREYWVRTAALSLAGVVIAALFRAGLLRMALDAARKKKPALADLARGARWFLPMLALEMLKLVVLVLSAPLLFVPYVFVWMGLALAPFWLIEGETLGASMRESWRASRGERLHLLGFFVAAAVVEYLGLLLCCVGTFPAAALTSVATAHVYLRLSGERSQ